jgi:hypothetical protein
VSVSGRPNQPSPYIDLSAVRETLSYIESDLTGPPYAELRALLGLALAEIGRIESDAENEQPRAVRFLSARP